MLEKIANKVRRFWPRIYVKIGDYDFYGEPSRVYLLFGCVYIANSLRRAQTIIEFTKPAWLRR